MASTNTKSKQQQRKTRHARVRAKISGTEERPRLAVFKSNRYVYAELIDDVKGHTLAQANSRGSDKKQKEQAVMVGKAIAQAASAKKIKQVVFDRGGFNYTGIIKDFADTARAEGLTF